jgi:hypothetical protein
MKRSFSALILSCGLLGAASAAGLDLQSALGEDRALSVKAGFDWDSGRAFGVCRCPADGPGEARAGVTCAFLTAGLLLPAGLLREAENPLGFEPGSSVFREASGWTLDGALAARGIPGASLSPIPGALTLFVSGREAARVGALLVTPGTRGVRMEYLAQTAEAGAEAVTEEWYRAAPAFPGGRITTAAGRVVWDVVGFRGAVSAGMSGSDACPPGAFAHCGMSLGGRRLSAEVILAAATRDYRTLSAETSRDAMEAGITLSARGQGCRVVITCCARTGREERPCQPCLPGRSRTSFIVEKGFPGWGETGMRLRVEGEKARVRDETGAVTESRSAGAALAWGAGERESRLSAMLRDREADICCRLASGSETRLLWLEASLKAEQSGQAARGSASILAGARAAGPQACFTVQGGLRSVPLEGPADLAAAACLCVEWSARTP